jgi:hypothetical protein
MKFKRLRLFCAIAAVVIAAVAACVWLQAPGSLILMVQGAGSQRHPVDFDIEFPGIAANVSHVQVELSYYPRTPILGISKHWTTIISPPEIDQIHRSLQVPVNAGRVHFTAPLALAGLSNFRLTDVQIGADAGEAPYSLEARVAGDVSSAQPAAPPNLDIPLLAVSDGQVRYDGPRALWLRVDAGDGTNPYSYDPRAVESALPIVWDGLQAFHARVDLAPYPLVTFVVPDGWAMDGWKNDGGNSGGSLIRSQARLTTQALVLSPGVTVPLPFARECTAPPQVAVVRAARLPAWSQIDGTWRPVSRSVWTTLVGLARPPDLDVRFVPGTAGGSLDRMESFSVRARAIGAYRIFAACPDAHYDSSAVAWVDVIVRPVRPKTYCYSTPATRTFVRDGQGC